MAGGGAVCMHGGGRGCCGVHGKVGRGKPCLLVGIYYVRGDICNLGDNPFFVVFCHF